MTLAVLSRAVSDGAAATRVTYFEDDDTFLLLDREAPEDPADYDGDPAPCCLDCLLDQHPEAGRGMDVARTGGTGIAVYFQNEWMIGSWDE